MKTLAALLLLATTAAADIYILPSGQWVSRIPDPYAAADGRVIFGASAADLIADGGRLVTREEVDARAAADAEAAAQAEIDRQAAKPRALRKAENAFFELTYAIYGNMDKRGFDVLGATLDAIAANPETAMQAIVLSLRLLAVDAQAKREGGNHWWDDAIYHGPLED